MARKKCTLVASVALLLCCYAATAAAQGEAAKLSTQKLHAG